MVRKTKKKFVVANNKIRQGRRKNRRLNNFPAEQSYLAEKILSLMNDGLAILDSEGVHSFVNDALSKMLGYEREELIGTGIPHLYWPPEELEKIGDAFSRALTGTPQELDLVFMRKNGERFPVTVSSSALRDQDGKLVAMYATVKDISEKKRIEDALRKSEEKYRHIVEATSEGIWQTDDALRISYVNSRAAEMLGYQAHKLIGRHVEEFVLPQDLRVFREMMKERVQGVSGRYELRLLRNDGSLLWILVSATALMGEDGRFRGSFGTFTEITGLKVTEDALRKAELRYRTFIDSTSDLVFLKDEEMRYLFVNKAFLDFFGKNEEEVVGTTDLDLMPADAALQCQETDLRALRSGEVVVSEEAVGGETYETTKFPVEISPGKKGIGAFIRDITKRKKAEKALRLKEIEFETLVSNSGDIIARFDRGLRHLFVNRAALELTGIPLDDYIGKTNEDLGMPKDLCTFWNENLGKVFETGKPHSFEFNFKGNDGVVRYLQAKAAPEISNDGVVQTIVSSVRDITDLRVIHEDLEKSRSELRQLTTRLNEAEENERKRIAGLLHDTLGQQLTAIGINLNLVNTLLPKKVAVNTAPYTNKALNLIALAMNEIRYLIAELRNPVLDDYGLLMALEWYCKEYVRKAGINVVIRGHGSMRRLETQVEQNLFRIAQEALTNVVRHALAREVIIGLERDRGFIRLTVEDDGRGFSNKEGLGNDHDVGPKHWGTMLMNERAKAIGGNLRIETALDSGTKVIVEILE